MLGKYMRETPKGLFLTAASWFILSAYVVWSFISVYASEGTASSLELTSSIPNVSWVWSMPIVLMPYIFGLASLLVFIGGPTALAIGLLRKKQNAICAARHLSIFWILLLLASFGVSLTDPAARPDFEDWFYVAIVVAYNLWSWCYLSSTHLQEKLSQELIFLNLHTEY